MYELCLRTPFGFVIELQNDQCYYSKNPIKIYINQKFYQEYHKNVISVFGLNPGTEYEIRIQNKDRDISLKLKTEDLSYLIDVTQYNAFGDGHTDDTSAINSAIYTAPKGSVVYLPKGVYSVNQIYLKSGVDLYLGKGCTLIQNSNRSSLSILKGYQRDYHFHNAEVGASWEGNPLDTYCSVIYGKEVENIRIYGEGTIDGNGEIGGWWENPKIKKKAFRPKNIFLNQCENITVWGLTSRNSASWNIHPFYCKNLHFFDLHIESNWDSPNTDGLNPESCENVEIIGCRFDVGDDCIAIKSGKYFMSQNFYQPCSHILISNCYMGNGHGGITIGSETSSGVEDLIVKNCYMHETDRGIRIKTRRGRGSLSVLKGIKISNLFMDGVLHCFLVNMFYNCDPDGKSDYVKDKTKVIRDDKTPEIKNIKIDKIIGKNIRGCAIFLYGLPESKISHVDIENCTIQFADNRQNEVPEMLDDFQPIQNLGMFMKNTEKISIRNNEFIGEFVRVLDEE